MKQSNNLKNFTSKDFKEANDVVLSAKERDDEWVDVLKEAMTRPTAETDRRNKEALEILHKLQGKTTKMSHEKTPEQKLIELYTELSNNPTADEYTFGVIDGIKDTLTLLGIKISGVNAE